jgi:hypothetical protein
MNHSHDETNYYFVLAFGKLCVDMTTMVIVNNVVTVISTYFFNTFNIKIKYFTITAVQHYFVIYRASREDLPIAISPEIMEIS